MTCSKPARLLLIIGLVLFACIAGTMAVAQSGTIRISVEPPTGSLTISGEGVTRVLEIGPDNSVILEAGEYEIKIDSAGFEPVQLEVTLSAGDEVRLRLVLSKPKAEGTSATGRLTQETLLTVLGFLLAFTVLFLLYLAVMQRRHYGTLDRALGSAEVIGPMQTPAAVRAATHLAKDNDKPIHLVGPGTLLVGRESRPFKARGINRAHWAEVEWYVTPSDKAVVRPNPDDRVCVIVTEPGVYELTAKFKDANGDTYSGTVSVIALERPVGKKLTIPWVGAGYGAILIAVIVIGALLLLGIAEIMEGDAIAPILGALVGYLFGLRGNSEG